MTNPPPQDWAPLSSATLVNQQSVFDEMRERCPVAHSDAMGWSVFRHADVLAVSLDTDSFINVSRFPAIPNGLNPPEHAAWYRALEVIFDKAAIASLEPRLRSLARTLLESRTSGVEADFVRALIRPFVFQSLCALLGWPEEQWEPLAVWVQDNQENALHSDGIAGKALADSFAALVHANLDAQRAARGPDSSATAALLRTAVNGELLSDEQITTILRNWVAGHGTTADAMGIVLMHVARNKNLQDQLRRTPALVPVAIEELLRLDGPLVANRRTTTRQLVLQGRTIPTDASLSLMWMAANRDPIAFENASDFNLGRNNSASLVWGKGIHVCMGAPLARLEIRLALEELLARTTSIELVDTAPERKVYPVNGLVALRLLTT
jgi:cytochrome P450